MDYYKRRNFLDKLKKYRKLLIGTGILVVLAIIGLLVGFAMNGWNIAKWWERGYGPTFVIVLVIGGLAAFLLWYFLDLVKGRRK